MPENKFTKGPWVRHGTTVYAYIDAPGKLSNRFTAQVQSGGKSAAEEEELLANAALIRAAPEMYEALDTVLAYFEDRNLGGPAKQLERQICAVLINATLGAE